MSGSGSVGIFGETGQHRATAVRSAHVVAPLMFDKSTEPVEPKRGQRSMNTTITASPVNILMVDDQPGKLLSYEVMLGELGENLVKASSGREALELLLKMDFAVLLMDVSMPELDGFELAEMIRQHPRFQKTAIIFISAVHLTDVDRLKGYERGAVGFVRFPGGRGGWGPRARCSRR